MKLTDDQRRRLQAARDRRQATLASMAETAARSFDAFIEDNVAKATERTSKPDV